MTTRYRHSIEKKESIVYFNLRIDNIFNNVPFTQGYGSAAAKLANFEIKPGDILSRQNDYKLAIDFFNVSGISLPIMFVEILEGNNDDINATQYGFCLRHTGSGNDYASRVMFVPDENALTYANRLPNSPLNNNGLQDFSTNYYYYAVFTFAKLLTLFNTALYNCWSAMRTAFPASSPPCPPYFYFDEPSGRVCLILHQSYVRAPLAEMFWNSQTEKYIEAIRLSVEPAYYTGDQVTFKEFKLIPDLARPYSSPTAAFGLPQQTDIKQTPIAPGDVSHLPWIDIGNTNFYIMMQEYDCLFFWNNIKSIVFFTSNISVSPEYLPVTNNPNKINSNPVTNMTIASPSVITTPTPHNFEENSLITITKGSYSVGGVPITVATQYRARNVSTISFQLYNLNGTPTNVTAYNPAVAMWAYGSFGSNIGQFNNPSKSILAYFDIIAQSGVDWRSNAYSIPAYRKYHELTSDGPLNTVDLQIFLQLNDGALVPYVIGINDSIDMKLVFRRNGTAD